MPDNTEIKVDIESLRKDIENMNTINGRIDTAIDKLTDVSTSIKSMLAVHEEKIQRQEKIDEVIFDKLKERQANINQVYDDLYKNIIEEDIFHIINHCNQENLKIFITSNISIDDHKFRLKDLKSRLKTFYYVSISNPDDEMIKIIFTKLLFEKQFIIKNPEIFEFLVNRIERSYQSIYDLVDKLDKLSLEKKRQLTIPLIKEII